MARSRPRRHRPTVRGNGPDAAFCRSLPRVDKLEAAHACGVT
jgi:hypothetical protein